MINEDVLFALLFMIACVLVCAVYMLAGIRDMLCNIDYDLCQRNLADLYKHGCNSCPTTENDG